MVTINHGKLRSVILHIVMSGWISDILSIGKQTETIIGSNLLGRFSNWKNEIFFAELNHSMH